TVANSTSATFLRVVGSELIQKYLGEGPKLVRALFRVTDDLSPSIVFIDEIDTVGTKRTLSTLNENEPMDDENLNESMDIDGSGRDAQNGRRWKSPLEQLQHWQMNRRKLVCNAVCFSI
ncbi:hypothetical protein IFM89_004226, partial [Coptis chinensis]